MLSVQQHPAALVVPGLPALGGLIAAVVLSFLDLSGDALAIVWSVWGLIFVYCLSLIARWPGTHFVVTSQRLLLIRGLLTRDVVTIPLSRATQLSLRRSPLGRVLGYGQFILEGAEVRQAIKNVKYVPYPEQVYLEITGLIFKPYPDEDD